MNLKTLKQEKNKADLQGRLNRMFIKKYSSFHSVTDSQGNAKVQWTSVDSLRRKSD